jgi:sigma-E factor negative regulatory protein RseB
MTPRLLAGVFLYLLVSAPVLAEPGDLSDWLQRMAESPNRHSHEGTFILQREDRLDTVRIVHHANEAGYRQRLQVMTGAPREVIRSVEETSASGATRVESRGVSHERTRRTGVIYERLLRAGDHYRIHSPGDDRIAGLPCFLLRADARDAYRFSHQYCLHSETGLPLLSELLDHDGRMIERMVFTEIRLVESIPANALEARDRDARIVHVQAADASVPSLQAGLTWYFEALPAGFEPIIASNRTLGQDVPPLLHFVLSDGLATVSVYIGAQGDGGSHFVGDTRSGATHAIARSVSGHQITVVGEVPADTIERIAASARWAPPSGNSGADRVLE